MQFLKKHSVLLSALVLMLGSCTLNKSMKMANTRVEFEKEDFEFTEQVSGEATETRIFFIDWARLFTRTKSGSLIVDGAPEIPVIGGVLSNPTQGYALYDMMNKNEGYDVVFYPTYTKKISRPILGMGFILKTTEVKAKARLAKIK